ncbi:MAG TPA: hypothetical protein VMT80_00475 [Candidatus Paceibacterota bacterium]|nr:hypothetical protein [Candidatus Paceibacterota bacterium]
MKKALLGVLLLVLVGVGGVIYRNALEHPSQPIACPLDAKVCPDGTAVSRTGTACTFPACPPPNVSLPDAGIAFALPAGFAATTPPDSASLAAYDSGSVSTSTEPASIVIRRFQIEASSTALATIQATAIGGASGAPLPATAFSSVVLGANHRFTVAQIERFEGTVDVAYYLARGNDVLRFDAIDRQVQGWTDASIDVSTLPAQKALRQMLATLQGQ